MQRCHWCTQDPLYRHYHDTEWGVPSRDPGYLFEMLVLEGFQAGLSWWIVLQRRDYMRQVLAGFDPHALAAMDDASLDALLQDTGIIRHRRKLQAARSNAAAWLGLDDPVGLVWSVVNDQPVINHFSHFDQVPATTPQSEALSRSLKKLGFSFVGPTICQSYLQAIGAFMDHTTDCFRHGELAGQPSTGNQSAREDN